MTKLARIGHRLSVRRARIEEQNTPIEVLTRRLEAEVLNQKLQAEMLDQEYFAGLRQPETVVEKQTTVVKNLRLRLAAFVTGLF
jgi:hypothetical protein